MKKLWLLIAINQFPVLNPNVIPQPDLIRREVRGANVRDARGRRVPEEEEADVNALNLKSYVFDTLVELEEMSHLLLRQNGNLKFMVFEAKSVIEVPPVNPICKEFDANGQLLA